MNNPFTPLLSSSGRASSGIQKWAHPNVETLEDRTTPAASVFLNYGNIVIVGDNVANTATVSNLSTYWYRVSVDGLNYSFYKPYVWNNMVSFYGNEGDDSFGNSTALRSYAYGHLGNDSLSGGTNMDYLDGGAGDDYLSGGAGNDVLYGRLGADRLFGLAGNDALYGGGGGDYMDGGDGSDRLVAALDFESNFLYGGNGIDYLYGGYGTDYLYGGNGSDYLFGNLGLDYLYGEAGNDYLNGGNDGHADALTGGAGYDRFVAEWYWSGSAWRNRDRPLDFHAGDSIIS